MDRKENDFFKNNLDRRIRIYESRIDTKTWQD